MWALRNADVIMALHVPAPEPARDAAAASIQGRISHGPASQARFSSGTTASAIDSHAHSHGRGWPGPGGTEEPPMAEPTACNTLPLQGGGADLQACPTVLRPTTLGKKTPGQDWFAWGGAWPYNDSTGIDAATRVPNA